MRPTVRRFWASSGILHTANMALLKFTSNQWKQGVCTGKTCNIFRFGILSRLFWWDPGLCSYHFCLLSERYPSRKAYAMREERYYENRPSCRCEEIKAVFSQVTAFNNLEFTTESQLLFSTSDGSQCTPTFSSCRHIHPSYLKDILDLTSSLSFFGHLHKTQSV